MQAIIFSDTHYRVERHTCSGEAKGLFITFTPFTFRNLDEGGFGVSFLLTRGYDVIAFKCDNDSWFQGVPADVLTQVHQISTAYDFVCTYGSSMGGFAAIAFSRALKADQVIVFSPQYAIDEEFDRRWSGAARRIPVWHHRITPEASGGASLVVIYDNMYPEECEHVSRIRAASRFACFDEIRLPFSGHPSGIFLSQVGAISQVIDSILAKTPVQVPYLWSRLKKSAAFLTRLGQYANINGRSALARACFRKVAQVEPNNAGNLHFLSTLEMHSGNFSAAVCASRRAVDVAPNNAAFIHQLGHALHHAGNLDDALTAYQRAITLNGTQAIFRHNFSRALGQAGRLSAALENNSVAIRLEPGNAAFHHQHSLILHRSGALELAISASRDAVRLAPVHIGFRQHLVALLALSGRLDEALGEAQVALDVAPATFEVHNQISTLMERVARLDEALTHAIMAVDLAPGNGVLRYRLSVLLARAGKLEAAYEQAERACAIAPGNSAYQQHRVSLQSTA